MHIHGYDCDCYLSCMLFKIGIGAGASILDLHQAVRPLCGWLTHDNSKSLCQPLSLVDMTTVGLCVNLCHWLTHDMTTVEPCVNLCH